MGPGRSPICKPSLEQPCSTPDVYVRLNEEAQALALSVSLPKSCPALPLVTVLIIFFHTIWFFWTMFENMQDVLSLAITNNLLWLLILAENYYYYINTLGIITIFE